VAGPVADRSRPISSGPSRSPAAIPFVPLLAEAFHATPLDASDWAVVAVIALLPAILAEVVRTVTKRTWVA
jgi:hypothetical protein